MAISAAGIIFSSLNDNTLSRLTSDRTVAAIPFACRYRLVDFALSNMVNANMTNISVVSNYNYRSLVEHIGSGKDWDLARRKGGIKLISPYQTAYSSKISMFSTRMEALLSMKEYIQECKEDYIVLMDSDYVLNIDLEEVIESHQRTGADVTIVTKNSDPDFSSKHPTMMLSSVAGKISDIAMSSVYVEKNPEISLNIFVMEISYLRALIEEAEAYNYNSLSKMFIKNCRTSNYRSYNFKSYVASVSSFLDYYKCSIELATNEDARVALLGKKEAPIYTRVHNSVPVIYKSTAHVENSMIADDCVIEGTVINSVLSRGVTVEKGAIVRNSVLFRGTHVGKNSELNCIVTDKDVFVSDGVVLSGNNNMPFYVQKNRKV